MSESQVKNYVDFCLTNLSDKGKFVCFFYSSLHFDNCGEFARKYILEKFKYVNLIALNSQPLPGIILVVEKK